MLALSNERAFLGILLTQIAQLQHRAAKDDDSDAEVDH